MNKSFVEMLSEKMRSDGHQTEPATRKSIAGRIYTDCFVLMCDWYEEHGAKPVPRPGIGYSDDLVAQFELFFEPGKVRLETDLANPDGSNVEISLQLRAVPLVAGFLAGFDQATLSKIAIEHDVDPLDFMYSFRTNNEPFRRSDDSSVPTTTVFAECFKALEVLGVDRILDAYNNCDNECHLLGFGLTLMQSPALWPSTLLLKHQDAQEDRAHTQYNDIKHGVHDFMYFVRESGCLPTDDSGIRYDWFLERSGMLLPGVNRKSLGHFTLWEDLIWLSCDQPENKTFQGILDYCIHQASDSMKPAIRMGLQSMMLDSSQYITQCIDMMKFMRARFEGTWLESVTSDPVFQFNMVGRAQKNIDQYINVQHPSVFPQIVGDLSKATSHTLLNLTSLPAEDFSLAHFNALPSLIKRSSALDNMVNRESCVLNLLRGFDALIGNQHFDFTDKEEVEDIARYGCLAALKMLTASSEFDYSALKGANSEGLMMLVEVGVDVKKLPKMNNRDRGRALEIGMGL